MKTALAALALTVATFAPAHADNYSPLKVAAMTIVSKADCGTPISPSVMQELYLEIALRNGVDISQALNIVVLESVRMETVLTRAGKMAEFCAGMRQIAAGGR